MPQGHVSPGSLLPPGAMGNALGSPWPFGFGAEGAMTGSADGYRVLTTCSWEQSDTMSVALPTSPCSSMAAIISISRHPWLQGLCCQTAVPGCVMCQGCRELLRVLH